MVVAGVFGAHDELVRPPLPGSCAEAEADVGTVDPGHPAEGVQGRGLPPARQTQAGEGLGQAGGELMQVVPVHRLILRFFQPILTRSHWSWS